MALPHRGRDQLAVPTRPDGNPYDIEHKVLFEAIRSGKPVNAGDYMARSTMIAVMGQLACYSGKEMTWDQVDEVGLRVPAQARGRAARHGDRRVRPDANGNYPGADAGHHGNEDLTGGPKDQIGRHGDRRLAPPPLTLRRWIAWLATTGRLCV